MTRQVWVYWCSNYPEPEEWIGEIWPGEAERRHLLSKFQSLSATCIGEEAMNRFYRELSERNRKRLMQYVSQSLIV